jgi:hypothetical protein
MAPFDGLNMAPRPGEPESAMLPGMAAPRPQASPLRGSGLLLAPLPAAMPDTSLPGPVALQTPNTWTYDFDPGTGSARATFNGQVSFTSGGSVVGYLPLAGGTLTGDLAIAHGGQATITVNANDASNNRAVVQLLKQGVAALVISADGSTVGQIYYEAEGVNGFHQFFAGGNSVALFLPSGVQLQATPTAPTAPAATSTTQVATTAFVKTAGATSSNVQNTLGSNTATGAANNFVNGPNTGAIGAAGQVWHISAGAMVSNTGATYDYFTARIWNGAAAVGPAVTSVTPGGNTTCLSPSAIVTLAATTTFTLQAADNSTGNGSLNTPSWIMAIRLA